jgi:thiol-disulfide isomerase/thioredoxin
MARWQPYVYGGGQLIHILGLAWSGGYGVQRKVAGAEQALTTLPQKIGMGMMGARRPDRRDRRHHVRAGLPEGDVPDLEGRPQAMAQWRGKVLVINYWASWCAAVHRGNADFSRLHEPLRCAGCAVCRYRHRRDGEDAGLRQEISGGLSAAGWRTNPGGNPALTVKGLPYTVVVGRDGKVAFSRYGSVDEAALEPLLRQLSATK